MEQIGRAAERALGETQPRTRARGRQDRSGQEKVIDVDKLLSAMPALQKLDDEARAASKAFSDKIKNVAEKSGLLASVVRKAVVAKRGEVFEEKKKEAEQLGFVFEKLA